jgi:hypothetical protein
MHDAGRGEEHGKVADRAQTSTSRWGEEREVLVLAEQGDVTRMIIESPPGSKHAPRRVRWSSVGRTPSVPAGDGAAPVPPHAQPAPATQLPDVDDGADGACERRAQGDEIGAAATIGGVRIARAASAGCPARGPPPLFKRISIAAAAVSAPVLSELSEWHPGRVLKALLICAQLLVIAFYASELHNVYLVAQANPAISQDVRSERILLFPNLVVCNANAPGAPLESLACELAAASGRATQCTDGIERFELRGPGAGRRALADADEGEGDAGAAGASVASEPAQPAPATQSEQPAPPAQASDGGDPADGAPPPTAPTLVQPAPPEPAPLPIASLHCLGYPSALGPAERYEHLDLSIRVHADLFPPPPVPRAAHVWLLGDEEYALFKAGRGRARPAASAAERARRQPGSIVPWLPELPAPDLHGVEIKYLTKVALDRVEDVRLLQPGEGEEAERPSASMRSFIDFYRRALGFDERRVHASSLAEPDALARADARSVDSALGAADADELTPDEARAAALASARTRAPAGAAPAGAESRSLRVRYVPATVSVNAVQGPFQSLDCIFLELRWRSTDVLIRTQYVTFTWTQLLAGVFATTGFTTLARSLLLWCVEVVVAYARALVAWHRARRRRRALERAATAEGAESRADVEAAGSPRARGAHKAPPPPAPPQHNGYDKLE